MKDLFLVRHGYYDRVTMELNDRGCMEIEELGRAMKKILDGSSAYIISSTAQRALNSSGILVAQLDLPEFEKIPYLWSGPDAPEDTFYSGNSLYTDLDQGSLNKRLDDMMKIVDNRKNKADGLIIVTHVEVVEYFSGYFMEKKLGITDNYIRVPKGSAVHISLGKKLCEVLP